MRTFIGGLDLKFVAGDEFESLANANQEDKSQIIARNALRLLMMGWPKQWTQLISWNVFKAVFVQRDPGLLKELRFAFQQGFYYLYEQVRDSSFDDNQHEQVQLYLSNCLSLLPYSDLTPYESITIPQYIEGQWSLVEYYVNPIELTRFTQMRGAGDSERVYAYGLAPIQNAKASAHLIFMGTTYPAGQGFLPQINTDLEGSTTVGHSLYLSGRANIIRWLEQQHHKVHVCGVSLGGSLSLLLAIDQGHLLSRVDALNPAGLHLSEVSNKNEAWNALSIKPQVVIQRQGNDPVSSFGEWIADWTLLQVKPPLHKQGPNAYCDHFLNYAGLANTEFTSVAIEEDNQKRKRRNYWIYFLGRNTVYYGVIAPYTYAVRPLLYFLYQNSLIIAALVGISIIVGAAIYTASVLIAAVGIITTISLAAYLIYSYIDFSKNNAWFIKLNRVTVQELAFAQLHAPQAPRNPAMDLYNSEQKIILELTQTDLNTYYSVMRCLVKNKEVIVAVDEVKEELSAVGMPLSEPMLLESASDNDSTCLVEYKKSDAIDVAQSVPNMVVLEKTKAKAIFMRYALTLIERLGQENKEALRQTLSEEYSRYQMGKIRCD